MLCSSARAAYADIFTSDAVEAITALAPLDDDRRTVMASRIERRQARVQIRGIDARLVDRDLDGRARGGPVDGGHRIDAGHERAQAEVALLDGQLRRHRLGGVDSDARDRLRLEAEVGQRELAALTELHRGHESGRALLDVAHHVVDEQRERDAQREVGLPRIEADLDHEVLLLAERDDRLAE